MSNQNISEAAKKYGLEIWLRESTKVTVCPIPVNEIITLVQSAIDADRAARKPQEWSPEWVFEHIFCSKTVDANHSLSEQIGTLCNIVAVTHNSTLVPQPPKEQCLACGYEDGEHAQLCPNLEDETPPISEQATLSQTGLLPCPFCGNAMERCRGLVGKVRHVLVDQTDYIEAAANCPISSRYFEETLWSKRATPTTREETHQPEKKK